MTGQRRPQRLVVSWAVCLLPVVAVLVLLALGVLG